MTIGSEAKRSESNREDVGPPETNPMRPASPSLWQRATYRWTAITAVMAVLLAVSMQHPYYRHAQFVPFRILFPAAFFLWLIFGIFYIQKTLKHFPQTRFMMRDGGLHLLLVARAWQKRKLWRTLKRPRVRTTVLGICVKAFFTPLMTGFLVGHLSAMARLWLTHKHLAPLDIKIPSGLSPIQAAASWWAQWSARMPDLIPRTTDVAGLFAPSTWTRGDAYGALEFAYNLVFFVDCAFALVGYASESRWLGNKTRSVDPTAFGWLVCLACYPPFNNVTGIYLPLDPGPPLLRNENVLLAFKAVSVLLFAIYASATVSFGFKFSNLTNRGIVHRGPYRFVRHPAYLCKCSAWWLEHLPTMTPTKAFFLTLLCGVYALRAWTEERHLGCDPDYVAYKKKVPWVLLPGIY